MTSREDLLLEVASRALEDLRAAGGAPWMSLPTVRELAHEPGEDPLLAESLGLDPSTQFPFEMSAYFADGLDALWDFTVRTRAARRGRDVAASALLALLEEQELLGAAPYIAEALTSGATDSPLRRLLSDELVDAVAHILALSDEQAARDALAALERHTREVLVPLFHGVPRLDESTGLEPRARDARPLDVPPTLCVLDVEHAVTAPRGPNAQGMTRTQSTGRVVSLAAY